ncbi:ergothioneine biosynthesis glutamate--cysteine ligase EgtA [Kitasatospora sp. NPDC094015]|uniref:ergothioneine biosynthesis glutamate--cysteine ligase EgtA n=1 Tax=Kitasatospora sp. NPDC094015 TaxID=3155205 RepID=UPI00331AFC75
MTPLTEASAEEHLAGICFKIGPPRLIGVETEWFVHDSRCPDTPVDPARAAAAIATLPGHPEDPRLPAGATLTHEPGGQVELSSPPAEGAARCATDLLRDQAALRAAYATQGLCLTGSGTDPLARERRMQLAHPRYVAMEKYFDQAGPWGRIMMCGTASVQVSVDAGTAGGAQSLAARWRLVHLLGPVLVAAFANSPLLDGRPTGYRSTRQMVWSRMDPSRTLAPRPNGDGDPRTAWARYVLDARVLCVQRRDGLPWTAPTGLTFRDWLRGAGERPATLADLDYHRTTLFPPVRPRGHMELRMLDAQPGDGWLTPLALVSALLDDPVAADEALEALERLHAVAGVDARGGANIHGGVNAHDKVNVGAGVNAHGGAGARDGVNIHAGVNGSEPGTVHTSATIHPTVNDGGSVNGDQGMNGDRGVNAGAAVNADRSVNAGAAVNGDRAVNAGRTVNGDRAVNMRRSVNARGTARADFIANAPRNALWQRAAVLGMTDPELRRAALACFGAAERALSRGAGAELLRERLTAFAERYPARGRCPADDQLDTLRAGARPVPEEAAPC